MSSRFHNKWHRHNHHTKPSTDPRYPDSAHDPIASPGSPFQGDFILNGTLSAHNIIADNIDAALSTKIANTLYVSISGSDANEGTSIFTPLRTIKKACEIAHNANPDNTSLGQKYTIFVGTGDYTEYNPILIPGNTSIIGDNLRRVTIRPSNNQYDILWVNNSVYVWGVTFRGHKSPAAAVAFPDYQNTTTQPIAVLNLTEPSAGWIKPAIFTSPYIQGSSSITSGSDGLSAGAGMRIDGSLAQGYLRSMVLDSYTQFNEGGKGIDIINNGYAQLVSIFTICCTEGVSVSSGGSCSINTSNCSFGLSGLAAFGRSKTPVLSATVVGNPDNTRSITVNSVSGVVINPGLAFPTIANTPYNGLVFQIGNDGNYYPIDGNPVKNGSQYTLNTLDFISTPLTSTNVNFYIRSTITSSSHTFEYIGSGVILSQAVPALGGVATTETEGVAAGGGAVFFTSTNHLGNFKVGNDFTIVQETGTIEGDTFKRSILSLVTPLTLSLE